MAVSGADALRAEPERYDLAVVLLLIRQNGLPGLPSIPCCLNEQLLTSFSGRLRHSPLPLLPEDSAFLTLECNALLCDCTTSRRCSMCDLLTGIWPNTIIKKNVTNSTISYNAVMTTSLCFGQIYQ